VQFSGPTTSDQITNDVQIGVFGPHAEEVTRSEEITKLLGTLNAGEKKLSLVAITSDSQWGKASDDLVNAVYRDQAVALVALDRASSHLAEQIAVKAFVPVVAISADRALTSTNIPWIFRLPETSSLSDALNCVSAAIAQAGPSRSRIREVLASGKILAGVRFKSTGETKD